MKVNLFYFNWQLQTTVFTVLIDDLEEALRNNEEIYVVSCRGGLLPCWSNKYQTKSRCEMCRFNHKAGFQRFKGLINHLYIDDFAIKKDVLQLFQGLELNYKSINDIRKIRYKGVSIGYGALSSYISNTRNLEPVFDDEFYIYFNGLLTTQIFIKEAIDRIIEKINPNVITIFNGRVHDTRPVYETAVNRGIPLRGVETIVKDKYDYYRRIFPDVLPHNIDFHSKSILLSWELSDMKHDQKTKIAEQYYQIKRDGQDIGLRKTFTSDQEAGRLPNNWNPDKVNIVIFNSSEDEFAAIGKEWDKLKLFDTQEDGIHYILKEINNEDYHFYLRIHPNLKSIQYGYHKRLYDLTLKYSNLTVISAHSKISTYALMEAANKVVVFGSSTGVEANFLRKAVILLGGTFYYQLNVAYVPKDPIELIELIQKIDLEPKPVLGSLQFAFYINNYTQYAVPVKYNPKEIKFKNRTFMIILPALRILDSPFLYKILSTLIRLKTRLKSVFMKEELVPIPKRGH